MTVLVAVMTLTGAAASLRGESSQESAREVAQRPTFGVDSAVEMIRVSVLDASGVPIRDLTAADFLVREDGEERDIAFVEMRTDAPLDVALVLDASGSMRERPWQNAALDLLQILSPRRDCVLLVRFGDSVSDSIWARPDDPALVAVIDQPIPFGVGGSLLYDALAEGIRQLFTSPADTSNDPARSAGRMETAGARDDRCPVSAAGDPDDSSLARRPAVVVVTDGADFNSSRLEMYRFEQAVHVTRVSIFQIALGTGLLGSRGFRTSLASTGGEGVGSGPEDYQQLGHRLRDFYSVEYQIPATGPETRLFEYTRHEIEVELPGRHALALHRSVVYRPAFDSARARSELDEGILLLQSQQLEAALAAFDRSIAAHPYRAAPYAYRARILLLTEGVESALRSAVHAAELDPVNGEHHLLVTEMARIAERYELAWTHAIRAAQAGSTATDAFEALAACSAPPANLRERLDAPRIVVLGAPPAQSDLIVRAALPKAIRSIQNALSQSAEVALVADLSDSQYVVWVAERELSDELPRRFRGRVVLADLDGDGLYRHDFTLEDLDDPAENAGDLAEHIEKMLEKVAERR